MAVSDKLIAVRICISSNYAQNVSLKCMVWFNYCFVVLDTLIKHNSFKSWYVKADRQDKISLIKYEM
jgi:hypothetical protein